MSIEINFKWEDNYLGCNSMVMHVGRRRDR